LACDRWLYVNRQARLDRPGMFDNSWMLLSAFFKIAPMNTEKFSILPEVFLKYPSLMGCLWHIHGMNVNNCWKIQGD
jgi:hypothetical protein